MTTENKTPLRGIQPGQAITAEFLNTQVRAINANTKAVRAPRMRTRSQAGAGQEFQDPGTIDLEFTETSRTTSVRTLTDSNGETVNIDVIDSVTFENSGGFIMTLNFNNPA